MDSDFATGEDTAFVYDEISNIIKEAIEATIGGNAYQHNKVGEGTWGERGGRRRGGMG